MKYRVGDILEGEVTGIQNYGIFVRLDEATQGLIHISECGHGFVDNLQEKVTIGDSIKVQIIDYDEYSQKLSLSIRTLKHLNVPPFPARIRPKNRPRRNEIGFATVEKQLPKWIEEGLYMEENDVFHLNKN